MKFHTLMIAASMGMLALAQSGAANAQIKQDVARAVKCAPGVPLPGCQTMGDKAINKGVNAGATAGQKIQNNEIRKSNAAAAKIRRKQF